MIKERLEGSETGGMNIRRQVQMVIQIQGGRRLISSSNMEGNKEEKTEPWDPEEKELKFCLLIRWGGEGGV